MTLKQNSSLGIVFILGLLAMLMPLSIDMYLPALPVIAAQYNVRKIHINRQRHQHGQQAKDKHNPQ